MPTIFMRNHENTSKAPPNPSKPSNFSSRQSLKKPYICDHASLVVSVVKLEIHQVLMLAIKALIKTRDMLRAKTVMTGAKMTCMIFARLK